MGTYYACITRNVDVTSFYMTSTSTEKYFHKITIIKNSSVVTEEGLHPNSYPPLLMGMLNKQKGPRKDFSLEANFHL